MARAFKLPDLGEGIHEGEVLSVRVAVGDKVKEGDIILEVETDKAAVEIPSPYTGVVEEIRVKPGDTVKVGQVMLTFTGAEEAVPAKKEEVVKKVVEPPKVPEMKTEPARKEGPVPASPATRRLSRELGVDLRMVTPTGPGGLVTADDVRAFAGKKEKVTPMT
jgi:pyruvate dehydrogenase E2 component (dihydrolipoamide acetyltransferase)